MSVESITGAPLTEDVIARVLKVIEEAQKLPPGQVQLDSTFEGLGIDSLDGIQLLFALETEFDINIPDEAAREVKSIRGLAEGVQRLILEKGNSEK